MNKYDDLHTFLHSPPRIRQDYDFITNYITAFLYKNTNREKIDEYYNKIPSIFDRFLGISNKRQSNDVKLLESNETTFEDFDYLLHLFVPGSENRNIFTSVYSPPDYVPDYIVATSLISKSIDSLVSQNKQEYVLLLDVFEDLSKNIELQRNALEKGNIILNVFEYFLVLVLIAIKDAPCEKNKINLPKINKNFVDLIRLTSQKRSLSERTKDHAYLLDVSRSLGNNFYFLLFRNLVNYLLNSKFMSDQIKLRFLVSAVQLVWMSDYFIIPSSMHVSKSALDIYSFFFRKDQSQYLTPDFTIPNITMLDCLSYLVTTLQVNGMLFIENPRDKSYSLREDSLIFKLQKPLFYFFKNCFLKFNQEYSNKEANLSDIARIWFIYITPWMQLNIPVNSNQQSQYQSSQFKSNYMKSQSTLDDVVREYIHHNMLFYTELFNDYIFAFSTLNVLTKNELSLLNKVLELYKGNDGQYIVNDYINMKVLEDLSMGKLYNYHSLIDVDNHVKYIGSLKNNLYPFNNNENRKYARNIVNNISNWIHKLESKDDHTVNDEIMNFLSTLKESQIILRSLYQLNQDSDGIEQSNQKNYFYDPNNIYFKKDYEVLQGNPWNRRISEGEIAALFYTLKYIAYLWDYFKGIPIRYDRKGNKQPPLTNIRYLANKHNLFSGLIVIIVFYMLIRIVWLLIVKSK